MTRFTATSTDCRGQSTHFHRSSAISFSCESRRIRSDVSHVHLKATAKARDFYIARLRGTKPDQPRFYNRWKWQLIAKSQCANAAVHIAHANEQLDPRQQLANTPPTQSTTAGLHPVSIRQMAPPQRTYLALFAK